jgi:hypothetical protein
VSNRFTSPTSVRQLEDALKDEWYKSALETVRNMWQSIPRRAAVLKEKGGSTSY